MPELVLKHIEKLKANTSGGPDGLPASFFNVTSDSIINDYRLYLTYHCRLVLFQFGNMPLLSQYLRRGHQVIHAIIDLFHLLALLANL